MAWSIVSPVVTPSYCSPKPEEAAVMLKKKELQGPTDERRLGGQECTHAYPILVTETDKGHYARCLACLQVGPQRPTSEAARRALLSY